MDDLARMERAARLAGRILLRHAGEKSRLKADHTVVTAADLASERAIIRALKTPGYGVMSEESAPDALLKGKMWVIDPLDGTNNYSRGIPLWCISIALLEKGVPVAGVIYDPTHDAMYSADRRGVRLDGKPFRRFARPNLFIFQDCAPNRFNDRFHRTLRRLLAHEGLMEAQLRTAALALAYTAEGKADAFVGYGQHLWDMAAGVVICRAAGLKVTDWSGRPWKPGTAEFFAAPPKVHARLLPILRR